jgi:DNA polymerase I
MVARELRTGQEWRIWRGDFPPAPPFPIGPDSLFVAYYASAELGCFRALGWPMPARVLDLYAEFRDRTNGLPGGRGLVDALQYFGLDALDATHKDSMRTLILGGGPWSNPERAEIIDYCDGDVLALNHLLPAMLPMIDLPRALLRGRYMAAVSAMEWAGVPIDMISLEMLRANWTAIQDALIADVDSAFGVYDGRSFREAKFENLLIKLGIPWPRLDSGRLSLDDDSFRDMIKSYPVLSPLRELRHALSELRLNDLSVGDDGRNRTLLGVFGSRTGRNQPSNTRFIFGPSVWLRSLIQPPPGHGVAYVDWTSQEVGIAGAQSADEAMMRDFLTGDPYIAFGIRAGVLPFGVTKATHPDVRDMLKACVLGLQYGMSSKTLSARIGQPEIVARELVRAHKDRYRQFWRMADGAVDCAMQGRSLSTVFGWHVHPGSDPNPRSMMNFPMQANGAEMMRLAACLATERGIEVCAPVHDAFLICAPLDRIEADVAAMRAVMEEAARTVLGGFPIETEAKIVRYPDRYTDKRGAVMWRRVMRLVDQCRNESEVA